MIKGTYLLNNVVNLLSLYLFGQLKKTSNLRCKYSYLHYITLTCYYITLGLRHYLMGTYSSDSMLNKIL